MSPPLLVLAAGGWIVAAVLVAVVVGGIRERRALRTVLGEDATSAAVAAALAAAAARAESAEADGRRLRQASDLRDGAMVVVDGAGSEVFRSGPAEGHGSSRHGDVLAEAAVDEALHRARAGASTDQELRLFGPPPRVLHLRAAPLRGPDGDVDAAVALVTDVSEAHRVTSVRRDFVANVSHELKTPVGALALLAETMTAEDDPAVQRHLADRVVREAERLARVVDELLDLSLIESDEPRIAPASARGLVEEAVDQVRPAADAAGVHVAVEPFDDVHMACDPRQVRSALRNLLDNAVKYSLPDGTVNVSCATGDGSVAFVVRDDGIGIPTRDLTRVFERFYRVDRARSRDTGGIGLGLAIVRHVADAHGGSVGVESREGEGSSFTLRIPVTTRAGGNGS